MSLRFLGIEVDRKTDVLALAAFVLSVGGITTQAYFFFRGSDIQSFPPEQILISSHAYSNGAYLRVATRMAYVNVGPSGSDLVKRETLSFKLGSQVYEMRGQDRTSSTAEGRELKLNRKGDALPTLVKSGEAAAHETYFAPAVIRKAGVDAGHNFIEWNRFLGALAEQSEIEFLLRFETYGGDGGTVTCRLGVTASLIANLRDKGWSAQSCLQDEEKPGFFSIAWWTSLWR